QVPVDRPVPVGTESGALSSTWNQEECSRLQQKLAEAQEKMTALRQKLAAREGALSSLQAAHSETLERLSSAQLELQSSQLAELTKQMGRKEVEWQQHQQQLRQQMAQLQQQLMDARALQPWTPKAHEFSQLEGKIRDLEAAEAVREARWRMLEGTTAGSHLHPHGTGAPQPHERIMELETQLKLRSQELFVYREELECLSNYMSMFRFGQ
ncbi:hypothetical protein WJX84_010907, partial [Apatococcus fuscideae]